MQVQTPEWVKHAIFYQIFPDRFAKGDRPSLSTPNPDLEAWDAPPTLQGYKGGNLEGVIQKLDYLQDLGINAIYLTPIFQSASNHRYHTHDYYQVDPMLGGNEALRKLLDEAHQRNIRVILDGVFNHASRGFFFFNDILENGPYSPWLDWFKIERWPLSAYDGSLPANYQSWTDNRALPQFNHDNPAVREYIMQVGEHWIKFGIDGWRLDVPFEVKTPGFWSEFRDRIKALNPDAYIVGEVWTDARPWLDGTQFDGVMNYLFTGPTIAFTAGDRVVMEHAEEPDYYPYPALDAAGYAQKMQHLLRLYPWDIQLTQMNLLDSHDTARLLTVVSGESEADAQSSFLLASLLMFTFPGAPTIYYGNEVGLSGGLDPDSRRVFPPQAEWNLDILNRYKQLIALRHEYTALQTGDYQVLFAQDMTYVLSRHFGEEALIVAVNAGKTSIDISLPSVTNQIPSRPDRVLYGDGSAHWSQDTLSLTVPAQAGLILG
ncbi:MAG TPA: glycoside hydrolase family 13 protein [Elainellaceae cyanobacterium]